MFVGIGVVALLTAAAAERFLSERTHERDEDGELLERLTTSRRLEAIERR